MNDVGAHLVIQGMVQGIGFRYFALECARNLGLYGWVRNAWDGSVETEVEGDRSAVEAYISQMKAGPRWGHVAEVKVEYKKYEGKYTSFNVMR